MKVTINILVLLCFCTLAYSQSIEGIWRSVDDEDGKDKSHIKIYVKNNQYFGEIINLLDADNNTLCTACKGANKDQPIVGMTILWDMDPEDNKYEGGRILDPKSGKDYSCILELQGDEKLKVRGYIGTPFIGRTQYWYKVSEGN